jgi:hypothetical protein
MVELQAGEQCVSIRVTLEEQQVDLLFIYSGVVDVFRSAPHRRIRRQFVTAKVVRRAFVQTPLGECSLAHRIPNATTAIDACDEQFEEPRSLSEQECLLNRMQETVERLREQLTTILPHFVQSDRVALEQSIAQIGGTVTLWKCGKHAIHNAPPSHSSSISSTSPRHQLRSFG